MVASLQGRRVIVSGGASGIGRATATTMAKYGAHVAVIDIDGAARHEIEATAGEGSGRILFLLADVADEQQIETAIGEAASRLGGLDVLIAAAGIMRGQLEELGDHDVSVWDQVIDVNLKGAFLAAKHAGRLMVEAGHGVIILVGSKAGVLVGSGSFSYGASKGGIHGLGLTLDRHLGPRGIRVNEVCPGDVDTPLYRRSIEEGVAQGADRAAADERLRSLTAPEEVAELLAFLASDAASAVRGTVFTA